MRTLRDKRAFAIFPTAWPDRGCVLTFLTVFFWNGPFSRMKIFSSRKHLSRHAGTAPLAVVALAGAMTFAALAGAQGEASGKADAAAQAQALYAQGMSAL